MNIPVPLVDEDSGLYAIDAEPMPDAAFVDVIYHVYDFDGITLLDTVQESFSRFDEETPLSGTLVGYIVEEQITGIIVPID